MRKIEASCLRGVLLFSHNLVKKLAQDDRGQGTVEYILILSACVVGASQMARLILRALDAGVLRLGGQLEKDLKTGRAPLYVWKN